MAGSERSLSGQWALVTGAARRIGAAIATTLHDAGANVAIHYFTSADKAKHLATELNRRRPQSAITIGADLRDISALTTMVDEVVDHGGRLDVLVNNASSFYPTALGSITEQQWQDLIDSNLKAPLFLCQATLPYLKDSKGVIVNILDVHSHRPLKDHPVYGASKAGLAMLTRSLARDLGPDIRVNGVAPGAILWPESGMEKKIQEKIIRKIPLKRTGDPNDIASAVLFLVRDAGYVTGHIIAVDGGRSIGW